MRLGSWDLRIRLSSQVGLVLIASPSFGSTLASCLDWIARLYRHTSDCP